MRAVTLEYACTKAQTCAHTEHTHTLPDSDRRELLLMRHAAMETSQEATSGVCESESLSGSYRDSS